MIRLLLALLLLAGCATAPDAPRTAADSLDAVARDYVRMTLELGEREPGYVDAYYGPPEWAAAAKAAPRTVPELGAAAAELSRRLAALRPAATADARRRAFLQAQLTAARTRVRMMSGEKLPFAEEAEGLFGVRPELRPLAAYDARLRELERLLPGPGPLNERVDAFQGRFTIPQDRLDPVFRRAIAECRARTARFIAMPPGEDFRLEFVTGKSWSGYNYYQGKYQSLIQVNTDLPIRVSRAVDLGCHEGYPGHHALNFLLEQRLTRGRGWIEFSIYPLYSPQSLIAEGSANYGIDLAFPAAERTAWEAAELYPLAGLPAAEAPRYAALLHALEGLGGARFTIARDYLDGRITRARAVELTQRYQLVSAARAEQSVAFTDQYRSYVINYGLGRDMVRAHVEAAGPDPAARWKHMERVISEPTLPGDLLVRP